MTLIRTVRLRCTAVDPDGAITVATVDFGDTSPIYTLGGDARALLNSGQPVDLTHPFAYRDTPYVVTFTVTDDGGLTASSSVEVSVPNNAPTVTITPDAGTGMTARFTVTYDDPDVPYGDVVSCTVSTSDGGETPIAVSGQEYTYTFADAGTYGLVARVRDAAGATVESAVIQFTAVNTPPVCAFAAVVGSDHKSVQINASASADPDGVLVSCRFHPQVTDWDDGTPRPPAEGWIAMPVVEGIPQPYQHGYATHLPGDTTIAVGVTDHHGAEAIVYTTINLENVPPTASLSVSATTLSVGETLRATVQCADIDGDAPPTATLTVADGVPMPVTDGQLVELPVGSQAGVLLLTLHVIDDDGAQVTVTVEVRVRAVTAVIMLSPFPTSPGARVIEREYSEGGAYDG